MSINATQTWLRNDTQAAPVTAAPQKTADKAGNDENDLSFWDLLDVVNPLQHIPVVSSIYREITGDTIKPVAKIVGGAVFGGPIGMVASIVDAVVTQASGGQDPVELAYNFITGNDPSDQPTTALASNESNVSIQSANAALVPSNDSAPQAVAAAQPANSQTPVPVTNAADNSNQAALAQLVSDMQGGGQVDNQAGNGPTPNAASAAKASDLVKSLQKSAPFSAVMPRPAPQFMKPSLTNSMGNVNAMTSAMTGKPFAPVIEIHPPAKNFGNNNTLTSNNVANNDVADKMMHALDAYQKMQVNSLSAPEASTGF